MYAKENTTTQQHGKRPAEQSADTLVEHLTAVLHHPLTPKNLYDDISCALRQVAVLTDAHGHPDCTGIIIHAALERQKVGGRKQSVDLLEEDDD